MRKEHDFIGELEVPDEVYYGVQTMRAIDKMCIRDRPAHDGHLALDARQLQEHQGVLGHADGARRAGCAELRR